MRRRYAFEGEGVPEKVQTELEKVENVVDEKCDTPADCDKMLDKIDAQVEKFDGALQSMADAAKDGKEGKSSQEEMGAKITEAATELKEVAKTIGVANESDSETATQQEIEDAKTYLEGAREIIETKKDELENGGEGGDGKCPDCGKDPCECEDDASAEECDAVESFVDFCLESYMDDLDTAMEAEIFDMAMEGVTGDAVSAFMQHKSEIKKIKKEMTEAARSGDYSTAAAKAKEAAGVAGQIITDINGLDAQSVSKAALVNIALAIAAMIAAVAAAAAGKALAKGAKKGIQGVSDALNNKLDARYAKKHNGESRLAAQMAKGREKAAKASAKSADKAAKASAKANAKAEAKGKTGGGYSGNYAKPGMKEKAAEFGKNVTSTLNKIPGSAKIAGAANAAGTAVSGAVSKVPGPVKGGAKVAGGGAAAGGAATAAAVMFLKKKGAVNADGDAASTQLDGKDINGLINLLKMDARRLQKMYMDKAAQYEEMASNSSSNASESFLDAIEGFMIGSRSETPAMESETGDFFADLWG